MVRNKSVDYSRKPTAGNREMNSFHILTLSVAAGMALLVGCAGPMPAPDSRSAVVVIEPQTFERDGVSSLFVLAEVREFNMLQRHWKTVPDGGTLYLIPQPSVDETPAALGVSGAWRSEFAGAEFGPFYAGNCYLAYLEPEKLLAPKTIGGMTYDYAPKPAIKVIDCSADTGHMADFTLR
jgi:hypothetical protein